MHGVRDFFWISPAFILRGDCGPTEFNTNMPVSPKVARFASAYQSTTTAGLGDRELQATTKGNGCTRITAMTIYVGLGIRRVRCPWCTEGKKSGFRKSTEITAGLR